MIYKGIVESIDNKYAVKVRIPLLHRTTKSNEYTSVEDLPEACICTLPNSSVKLELNDIVFVAFENNDESRPIIIGHLYKEAISKGYLSTKFLNLEVEDETKLSTETTIGNISYSELSTLMGIKENIQQQLNQIIARLDNLELQPFIYVSESLPSSENIDNKGLYFIK